MVVGGTVDLFASLLNKRFSCHHPSNKATREVEWTYYTRSVGKEVGDFQPPISVSQASANVCVCVFFFFFFLIKEKRGYKENSQPN
jgi:hypothetical protein